MSRIYPLSASRPALAQAERDYERTMRLVASRYSSRDLIKQSVLDTTASIAPVHSQHWLARTWHWFHTNLL